VIDESDILEMIRPSSMEPIEICSMRPRCEAAAVKLVPALRDMTTEAAHQGTLGHEVLADIARDAFAGDWSRAEEVIKGMHVRMNGLLPWCKDAVRTCTVYLCDLVRRYVPRYPLMQILAEIHLPGEGLLIPRGGTADLVLLCMNEHGELELVIVVDWKTGFVYQGEAADHLQLGCYAVMASDQYRPKNGVIVHLAMGRRHEFSSALYEQEAITGVRNRIRAGVTNALSIHAVHRPCLKACRFCKAMCFCIPLRNHLMSAIDELAMFGADPADRVAIAEMARLAKRFVAEADALAKHWRAQETENRSKSPTESTTP